MDTLIGYLSIAILITLFSMILFYIFRSIIATNIERNCWLSSDSKEYSRDIPFNSDLDILYFLGKKKNYIKNYTFIPAFLARMIRDNKVEYIPDEKSFNLNFSKFTKYENENSFNEFYDFIANHLENNIISGNKLSKILENNYQVIKNFDENIYRRGMQKLEDLELLLYNKTWGIFIPTIELSNKAIQIKELSNFIKDFSILEERKINEVKLWDEYMVMAALLGVKDAFDDDVKQLYMGLKIEKFYETMNNIINTISRD